MGGFSDEKQVERARVKPVEREKKVIGSVAATRASRIMLLLTSLHHHQCVLS